MKDNSNKNLPYRERQNPDKLNKSPKQSQTNTDWESASKWFDERQKMITGGEYSQRSNHSSSGFNEEDNWRIISESRNKTPENPKRPESSPPQRKKKISRKEQERLDRYYRKNRNSGKSKNELRREFAIQTKKRRRRKVISAVVVTALIALAFFLVLSLTVFFKIETIDVEGESRYSVEQIIEKSNVNIGNNLWRTTSKTVSEKVSKALPYIGKVTIKREIPSKITLVVEETSAKFALVYGKKYILIDENDKVLETAAKKTGKAIKISGVELLNPNAGDKLTAKGTESYEAAKQILNEAELNGIDLTEINAEDINLLWAIYKKNVKLDFGSLSQLDTKMKMANEIIGKLKSENALHEGVINLKSVSKAFYKEQAVTENKSESNKNDKNSDNKDNTNASSEPDSTASDQGLPDNG